VDLLHGAATPLPGDGSLRSGATLTALGGKALLVGGVTLWDNARDDDPPRTSLQRMGKAFLFDAAKHTWRRTGQSPRARWDHVAVRLQDGSVAVIGGVDDTKGVLPMERWDPRTGSFRDLGRLRWPRIGHTATLLPNGSVLVTGGCDITVPVPHFEGSMVLPAPEANHSSELVRPGHADSTSSELGDSRCGHTAVLLGDGRVLVVGGFPDGASLLYGTVTQAPRRTATAAVWSPSTGQWTPAASMHADRAMPAALPLPDGRVLVAGGEPKEARRLTAEAYDPKTDSWSVVGVLPKLFERPSMALLGEGRVLLQEGWGVAIQLRVGERRTP
jgi:hypothetical protein